MKNVSDVFKSIRFAKMDPKHDKGPAASTDDEEHGAVSSQEFAQQLAHVKKRAMQEDEKKMKGEDPCWTGYEMVGMKDKNGKKVPNCVPVSEAKDEEEYGYEGDMAMNQLETVIRHATYLKDMMKPDTDLPEWVQSKITLATDYLQTACDYMTSEMKEEVKDEYARKVDKYLKKKYNKEEVEHLEEGRPSQRHPLEGHEYHKKTNAELEYIAKDAHKAAEAMKSHNTTAENKYRDQANDSATVRYFRQKNGMPEWYKKKYGHMKEDTQLDELSNDMLGRYKKAAGEDASKADKAGDYAKGNKRFSGIVKATKKQFDNDMKKEETTPPFDGPYRKATGTITDKSGAKHTAHSQVKDLAKKAMQAQAAKMKKPVKESLEESRKAQIIKDASKSAKEKAAKTKDKFEADPILSSEIVKEDK